ncbi:MAG: hypothetical protein AB7D36_04765 [Oscillospiraceae bacterium]
MRNEAKVRLLLSKSQAYRAGYSKAVAKGDTDAAEKWKEGYQSIKDKISELKED